MANLDYFFEGYYPIMDVTRSIYVHGWRSLDVNLPDNLTIEASGVELTLDCYREYSREDLLEYAMDIGAENGHRLVGFVARYKADNTQTLLIKQGERIKVLISDSRQQSLAATDFFNSPDARGYFINFKLPLLFELSPFPDLGTALCDVVFRSHQADEPANGIGFLDRLAAVDDRLVVFEGWMPDVLTGTAVLFSRSRCSWYELALAGFERPDVSAHLKTSGVAATTDRHGFCGWAVLPGDLEDGELVVLEPTGAVRFGPKLNASAAFPQASGLTALDGIFETVREHEPGRLTELLGALAMATGRRRAKPRHDRFVFEPVSQQGDDVQQFPRSSSSTVTVVVPFYGDDFFLTDMIDMQAWAPAFVEWVFVCDDTRLKSSMLRKLRRNHKRILQPTKLLICGANLGFAGASNLGASEASGDYVLFMNSDVYLRDFSPIDYALSLMNAERNLGATGFCLSFEDGTIQHVGMNCRRHPDYQGMILIDHPGKGLPTNGSSVGHMPASLLTGALLMVRSDSALNGEYFDESYHRGDFEDADLCLRLRAEGRELALVQGPDMFHLERQSIRSLGSLSERSLVTLTNSMRFTRRWGTWLEEHGEVH